MNNRQGKDLKPERRGNRKAEKREDQEQEGRRKRPVRVLWRLVIVLVLAWSVGAVLNRLAASLDRSTRPAGFGRGALQGALMPMSLPNLLVGRDVTIYSQNNIGISYKLGYTTGVNVCGACFFGVLYWRLSRWRKGRTDEHGGTE